MRNEILKLPSPQEHSSGKHSSEELSALDGEMNSVKLRTNLSANSFLNKMKEANVTDGKDWWVKNEIKTGDNDGNNNQKSENLDDFSYDEKKLNEEFSKNENENKY